MNRGAKSVPLLHGCWTEGAFAGLGYATGLATLSVFLVGSFRPQNLPMPYWMDIRGMRTDTFGFGCFVVATFSICVSEYLRLSRIARHSETEPLSPGPLHNIALAAARALVAAGTTLVVYLSVNSVTHPQTLLLQATHLLSWPTEGTLRVCGLVLVACAVAVARALRISGGGHAQG